MEIGKYLDRHFRTHLCHVVDLHADIADSNNLSRQHSLCLHQSTRYHRFIGLTPLLCTHEVSELCGQLACFGQLCRLSCTSTTLRASAFLPLVHRPRCPLRHSSLHGLSPTQHFSRILILMPARYTSTNCMERPRMLIPSKKCTLCSVMMVCFSSISWDIESFSSAECINRPLCSKRMHILGRLAKSS